MFTTRSPSQAERATEILVVSHGSPSEPEEQQVFIEALAGKIAAMTGCNARGATLAKPGALERAIEGFSQPLVYPHFMADGWFVSTNLQNRLRRSGLNRWRMATPLGLIGTLPCLAQQMIGAELQKHSLQNKETTLVIAAHGSPSDPRPARATKAFAEKLRSSGNFLQVRVGYVDEEPSIEEAASIKGPAIVLPFFAARAGHVLFDLPKALAKASFSGPVLAPIGTWEEIPRLIAEELKSRQEAEVA
ncbi:MAG: sirohydrochlorin chelatase [Rhizobiaceae bacterium]